VKCKSDSIFQLTRRITRIVKFSKEGDNFIQEEIDLNHYVDEVKDVQNNMLFDGRIVVE
jgi:hypothetical protein